MSEENQSNSKTDSAANGDCRPVLCSACADIVATSELRWVRCGGLNVGQYRQPMEWRLRDRYSSEVIRQNAIYSQRLASAARVLSAARAYIEKVNDDCTEDEDRDEMLAKIDRYFKPNDKVSYHADNAGGAHRKDTNDK